MAGKSDRLTQGEISDRLGALPGWEVRAGKLVKAYAFDDFMEAIGFVNRLAPVAESQSHHPDLLVSWGRVVVELTTHEAGGLTAKDYPAGLAHRPALRSASTKPGRRSADLVSDLFQLALFLAFRVAAPADRGGSPQLPLVVVPGDEVQVLERAVHANAIPLLGDAHVLQLLVELVAPEGVHIVVGTAAIEDRGRGGLPLPVGVVPVLHPDAAEDRVHVVGDVAGRVDARQAGPAVLVDFDAVGRRSTRRFEEVDVGLDADPGDDQVAVQLPPCRCQDPLDPARPFQPIDAVAQQEPHSIGSVKAGDCFADLTPQYPGERSMTGIERRHLEAHHPERGRHLAADEPEPNHDRASTGLRRAPDALRVLDRAQVEDAFELRAGERQRAFAATCRYQQSLVGQPLTTFELDSPLLWVQTHRPTTEDEIDARPLVIGGRRDQSILEGLLASEKALRQRRPDVGRLLLGTDNSELAFEAQPSKLKGGAGPGQAATDDENRSYIDDISISVEVVIEDVSGTDRRVRAPL